MRWRRRLLVVALVVTFGLGFAPGIGHAQTGTQTIVDYAAAAQAPVMQVTEDGATAQFHPQGEGELTYAESDLNTGHAHALSSVLWPGAAGANLGSLLSLLGVPGLGVLNDPVRAEVSTSGQPQQNLSAGVTTMSASIQPSAGNTQQASAQTTTATASGVGGLATAQTSLTLGNDGTINASATSSATNLSIGGVIDFGSFKASASAKSTNAGTPVLTTNISAGGFTIGGQAACLDSTGVHMGKCGAQGSPPAVSLANQTLKQAGMQLYFTEPRQLTIANVAYDYAASLLVVWQIPGDPSHDVFTISIGGAAVALQVSGAPSGAEVATDSGSSLAGPGGGGVSGIPANPATPTLALPSTGATGPALASTRTPSSRRRGGNGSVALSPVSVASSHGIGSGWIVLLILAAVLGAVALPRLPGLLSAAAQPVCPDDPRPGNR